MPREPDRPRHADERMDLRRFLPLVRRLLDSGVIDEGDAIDLTACVYFWNDAM